MSIHIFHSGANRTMQAGYVFVSGANRPIKEIWVYHAGANRLVYSSSHTASALPDFVDGSADPTFPAGGVVVGTSNTHVTVTGGTGPFTYQWVRVSGDAMNASFPTSSSTNFTATLFPGSILQAVWQCQVTDTATGLVAVTNPVTAFLSRFGL